MRHIPITLHIPAPLLLLGVAGAAFFAGMLAVRAMGDVTSSTTAMNTLTFAGTLNRTGDVPLTFRFYKGADGMEAQVCAVPVTAKVDAGGNFTVQIPLTGADCKRADLFDGGDVKYRIDVDGTPLDMRMAYVTGVPYAQVAEHYASPDCPLGYTRSTTPEDLKFVVCKKGVDEVVKVGTGATAFWIDRYEASVWDLPDGNAGNQHGTAGDGDYDPVRFPKNGQRTGAFADLFAVSRKGVQPSTWITWFQAQQACRAAGKRLAMDEEWLEAASGTPDPLQPNDGSKNGECVTGAQWKRDAGEAGAAAQSSCQSAWGAQDMIGNVAEWTAQWNSAPGWLGGTGQQANGANTAWTRPDFHGDGLSNVASSAFDAGWRAGHPVASIRGGAWQGEIFSGVFALSLNQAPSSWDQVVGFRCVIPR